MILLRTRSWWPREELSKAAEASLEMLRPGVGTGLVGTSSGLLMVMDRPPGCNSDSGALYLSN